MHECFAFIYVSTHTCGGVWSLGIGVIDGWESPCGCWSLNLGSSVKAIRVLNHWATSPVPKTWEIYISNWHEGSPTVSSKFFPIHPAKYWWFLLSTSPTYHLSKAGLFFLSLWLVYGSDTVSAALRIHINFLVVVWVSLLITKSMLVKFCQLISSFATQI